MLRVSTSTLRWDGMEWGRHLVRREMDGKEYGVRTEESPLIQAERIDKDIHILCPHSSSVGRKFEVNKNYKPLLMDSIC